MNQKHAKLLRKGAEKLNLPYKELKKAFENLDKKEREKFLEVTKNIDLL